MCGICGQINFDLKKQIDPDLLRRMTRILQHRGPDDEGVWVRQNVGLGHRRLSIAGPGPIGHQPMANEDQSCWIVFDGEIYNYQELREDMELLDHRFRTATDTEVILHLYEEFGVNCVCRLRGMFAFALWDSREQRLLLARDRIGRKPLFFSLTNDRILFASEIKSILQDKHFPKEVDLESVHHFLTYGYIPTPRSIFRRIVKLPAGHILVWQREEARVRRYWDLDYRTKLILPNHQAYEEHFLKVFEETVRIRLRGDVPAGALLSGSLESSATAAMMCRLLSQPVRTFSISFQESGWNGLLKARAVAHFFHTEHHELVVRPKAAEVLPKLVWHFNEPFADYSAIAIFHLAQFASQEISVVLSGDGGDESFAGNERYLAERLIASTAFFPKYISRNVWPRTDRSVPDRIEHKSFVHRLKRFMAAAGDTPERRYVRWICLFDNESKESLYSEDWRQKFQSLDSGDLLTTAYHRAKGDNHLDRTLYLDMHSCLPDDLMVKMDTGTMSNSLEVRSPFLDHKLIEFAASLPVNLKLRVLKTKFLLRKALRGLLPKEILYHPAMEFGVPIARWLRKDLREMAYDLLLDSRCIQRGYFNRTAVNRLLDSHMFGRNDHSHRIWALLILELWHRMFIDESISEEIKAPAYAPSDTLMASG
ncbi:MAG: asparagine synthase (glutamine-hydrolyzing) [bacterium]